MTPWYAKAEKAVALGLLAATLVALVLPCIAVAQQSGGIVCARADKECALNAMRGHAVTRLAFWQTALAKPVEQRIGVAPPQLVEYLNYDNISNGFPARPRAIRVRADFLADVRSAFSEIPPEVKRLLGAKLAGIYFVENLGGTGYTDQIFDAADNAVAGYIVLDVSALNKRSANAWATWKENTPFAARAGFSLAAEIETRQRNDRKHAIQYILLHELAHVLAINENFHPPWDVEPKNVQATDSYPYFLLSWAVDKAGNRFVSIFDDVFPQRKDVVYYYGAKLVADQMVATYDNLGRTNFATLYAATTPADDFAEAFASYVHAVLMKKPFAIRMVSGGKQAGVYGSCWAEARCADKRKLLEDFLGIGR